MIIYVTRGLPASGKSTWSKSLGVDRWNNDEYREMVYGKRWGGGPEGMISGHREAFIRTQYKHRRSFVLDNTNLNPYHVDRLLELAPNTKIEIVDFKVPVEECVRRDALREHSVGEEVIYNMVRRWGHLYDWLG